jgi:16S rRNA (adenine(1408)-N(1))-methyltransferase
MISTAPDAAVCLRLPVAPRPILFVPFSPKTEWRLLMESIRGKTALEITAAEFTSRLTGYQNICIDLGTGDGRFVRHMATQNRDRFFIGLDACRENLRENSQIKLPNSLYIIASAQVLPKELTGLAKEITINFPWGSLLESLLTNDPALLDGLLAITHPKASLQIRLNGGALSETGWSLEDGIQQVYQVLSAARFRVRQPALMSANDLRACPTTWARRLAFGRDPRAYLISAERLECRSQFQTAWPMRANA